MKTKFICLFFSLIFMPMVWAIDFSSGGFVVKPYVAIGDNGLLTLNFQTDRNIKIAIELSVKNKKSVYGESQRLEQVFAADQLQKVNLGKLECDKELTYKLRSTFPKIEIENKYFSFPCSKDEDLYFGFMSDTQIKDESGQKRAEKISATIAELKQLYPFSLIVNSGDVVQHGGQIAEWNNFFKTAEPYLSNTYIFAGVGNHEYYDAPTYEKAPIQFRHFLRDENSSEVGNSVLDLGRVSIIMLNSNFDFMNETTYKEQWDWFIKQLEANQKMNKPVIVSMHHAPFSSSLDVLREIPTRLRLDLVPVLEKYSCVKMMMAGHLHMYERSQKGRIPYLVAGPAGGIINYITYKNEYQVFIKPFVTTFSVIKMTKNKLDVTTFTGQKEMIDHFSVDL